MNTPLLEVRGVRAGYRPDIDILHGIDLDLREGEIVSIVGTNGAGKSTLLKAIMGWVEVREGTVRLGDRDLIGLPAYAVSQLGIGYVPQLDNVFPSLTINENLELGAGRVRGAEARRRRDGVLELFPDLTRAPERAAGNLSGGQRQMLAMGRALMAEPSVLLLDEPTAGLAPELVSRLFEQVINIRAAGTTILMVEQNARRALEISDRGYVFDLGRSRFNGPARELLASPEIIEAYLGKAQMLGADMAPDGSSDGEPAHE